MALWSEDMEPSLILLVLECLPLCQPSSKTGFSNGSTHDKDKQMWTPSMGMFSHLLFTTTPSSRSYYFHHPPPRYFLGKTESQHV